MELMAIRALQKLLRPRKPSLISPSTLQPGKAVWVYYKTTKQNVPIGWISAQIDKTTPHYIVCHRSTRGPPMKVSYDHMGIQPSGDLAKELGQSNLEKELDRIAIPDRRLDDTQDQEDSTNLDFSYGLNDNEKNDAVIFSLLTSEEPIGATRHDLGTLPNMMKADSN